MKTLKEYLYEEINISTLKQDALFRRGIGKGSTQKIEAGTRVKYTIKHQKDGSIILKLQVEKIPLYHTEMIFPSMIEVEDFI